MIRGFTTYTRSGNRRVEKPFEKPVVVPREDDQDPTHHAWADARFATDIMSEHGLFFALLMPKELAPQERTQALRFSRDFERLHQQVDAAGPPDAGSLSRFTKGIVDKIKPFIEYKATLGDAQRNGTLRSLVWPLFFDHTRHEAERWVRRLEQLGGRESEYEREEVVPFWSNIMDEHARFVAHLLDPDEFDLIDEAMNASKVFSSLTPGPGGSVKALVKAPGTVAKALTKNPEMDEVLSAAELILDFKTKAARDIEAARIKSIIDPRLSDHVRREALKFVDELKRAGRRSGSKEAADRRAS
ncbi:MAG: DUF2935 domain-containing protein [Actinomycetota bacterium]